MINLFNRSETIMRSDPASLYYENGVPVIEKNPIPITCNIQPYRDGDNIFRTPEGMSSLYGIMVYSKEKLYTTDDLNDTLADELEYNGNTFACVDLADFTGHAMSDIPQHWLGLFYRKDKMSG